MKKKVTLLVLSIVLLAGGIALADVINMPGAPVMPEKPKPEYNGIYKHIDSPKPNYAQTPRINNSPNSEMNTVPNVNSSAKSQLDSIAMSILRDAEAHKGGDVDQRKLEKMMDLGATGFCPPQIIAKPANCPNPKPHEIQVNGKTLKGRLCAVTCYQYNGKQYDVGYCK